MSSIRCPYCKHEMALKGAKPGHYWPACASCNQKFSLTIPLEGLPVAVARKNTSATEVAVTMPPTGAPAPSRPAVSDPLKNTSIPSRAITPSPVEQPPELAGRLGGYELKSKLGQGGMGAVYLARQISLDRDVALKVLAPHLASDPEFVSRFTREAYAAAQLSHHNVVQIHDIGLENNHGNETNYFSMEFVEGQTLAGVVKENGKLDAEVAVGYVLQAARGLKFAHDHGLIHRDVKPENLLLNEQGVLKVADLGLVKRSGVAEKSNKLLGTSTTASAAVTQHSTTMGTPAYMPPEQARDASRVDARADIYSLGCTLYDLLTGRPPFTGTTAIEVMTKHATELAIPPDRLVKHVPGALSIIVMKMMAKRPDDRFQTMGQTIAALEGWLGVESGKAFSPREEHVTAIEESAGRFNRSTWANMRSNLIRAFFAVFLAAILILALPTEDHPLIAAGLVGYLLVAVISYQVIYGVARRTLLISKVRQLIFTSRIADWFTWAAVIGVVVLLLIAFNLQWIWLGFAIAAAITAAGFYFSVDVLVTKDREPPIAEAEKLLKAMRLRGLDENALRQFVCKYSGRKWEEFYESLFGYEAKMLARQHWGRGERGRNRPRYAAWRDTIIAWIEQKIRFRQLNRERKLLAKLESKAMVAQGIELNIAAKKAKRNAERFVEKATVIRDTAMARSAQTALPTQTKSGTIKEPKVITANWVDDDTPETDSTIRRERQHYLGRRFGTPLDILFAPGLRLLLGLIIIAGFGQWWNQNSGADARSQAAELLGSREEVTVTAQKKDLTTAVHTFKGFDLGVKGTHPLQVPFLPRQICDAVGSWNGGIAGALLVLSAVCSGKMLGLTVLLAAGTALFGDRLQLPFIHAHASIAAAVAAVLWFVGMLFFRRERGG